MNDSIKASEAECLGELVTTISLPFHGIGLGRLIGDTLYRSGGNGFYYAVKSSDYEYVADRGDGYKQAMKGLALPSSYKL